MTTGSNGETHPNQDPLALEVDIGNGQLVRERHFDCESTRRNPEEKEEWSVEWYGVLFWSFVGRWRGEKDAGNFLGGSFSGGVDMTMVGGGGVLPPFPSVSFPLPPISFAFRRPRARALLWRGIAEEVTSAFYNGSICTAVTYLLTYHCCVCYCFWCRQLQWYDNS
jgi:hypothetical protein